MVTKPIITALISGGLGKFFAILKVGTFAAAIYKTPVQILPHAFLTNVLIPHFQ
ncbi:MULTISPECIES: hypothetical protein [Lysinibacillus]|uniref:hypothetical protein n=1 Tax=Lysinibacillus TaxID=400634 RepID=UPI000ADCF577|nr:MULTISPECIES: hypothetical protein [Lysinibacillus]MBI6862692.1 hypothetical protein [Lysinibacillus fusiformis]QIC46374.1 hypothetical protein GAG94_04035 [Lysinibacillus sphaericus]QPA57301.1 hypothetical protein INQ55_13920 [Lysinibacillus sphaericus]QTB15443.1 hypothetical protein J2B92_09760 [Lysinibacillus sphaericus]QTB24376.1 hypothetical protein J1907_10180 [Lysinibacillus sphaericus]